jgi:hypothetical protein
LPLVKTAFAAVFTFRFALRLRDISTAYWPYEHADRNVRRATPEAPGNQGHVNPQPAGATSTPSMITVATETPSGMNRNVTDIIGMYCQEGWENKFQIFVIPAFAGMTGVGETGMTGVGLGGK